MGHGIIKLITKIEKEFSFNAPVQRWERVITVKDVYNLVWESVGEKLTDKNDMTERINNILIYQIGCEPAEISPEKMLTVDLGLD
ncbi:MAG: hypothetical protein ABJB86_22520 [Bacteroidota bacterium]